GSRTRRGREGPLVASCAAESGRATDTYDASGHLADCDSWDGPAKAGPYVPFPRLVVAITRLSDYSIIQLRDCLDFGLSRRQRALERLDRHARLFEADQDAPLGDGGIVEPRTTTRDSGGDEQRQHRRHHRKQHRQLEHDDEIRPPRDDGHAARR